MADISVKSDITERGLTITIFTETADTEQAGRLRNAAVAAIASELSIIINENRREDAPHET